MTSSTQPSTNHGLPPHHPLNHALQPPSTTISLLIRNTYFTHLFSSRPLTTLSHISHLFTSSSHPRSSSLPGRPTCWITSSERAMIQGICADLVVAGIQRDEANFVTQVLEWVVLWENGMGPGEEEGERETVRGRSTNANSNTIANGNGNRHRILTGEGQQYGDDSSDSEPDSGTWTPDLSHERRHVPTRTERRVFAMECQVRNFMRHMSITPEEAGRHRSRECRECFFGRHGDLEWCFWGEE